MKHAGSIFPLLLIGVLAALTFWLQRVSETPAGDRSGRNRHDPDFIIDNFTLRTFGPTGKLQHTLTATRMLHYPDDDTTAASSPHVTFHAQPPTEISSDRAHVSKDATLVRLEQNVRLVRSPREAGALPLVAVSDRLDVFPDLETAATDTPVTITQGRSVVTGTGLRADNKTLLTTLLGPVRGVIYRNTGKTP